MIFLIVVHQSTVYYSKTRTHPFPETRKTALGADGIIITSVNYDPQSFVPTFIIVTLFPKQQEFP